jgi:hypothetical protein
LGFEIAGYGKERDVGLIVAEMISGQRRKIREDGAEIIEEGRMRD